MSSPQDFLRTLIPLDEVKLGISSIWGDYGVGKTTLSLQLLLLNLSNKNKGIYIYSKPNFPYKRFSELFRDQLELIDENLKIFNCLDFNDLYKLVFELEFLLLQDNKSKDIKFKLIIIDSLTDLYRLELDQQKKDKNFILNYKLNTILGNLAYINNFYNLNVFVVNETSTRTIDGEIVEIEAGGNVMDYWITTSYKLERITALNERKLIIFNKNKNFKSDIKLHLKPEGFSKVISPS